MVDFLYIHVPFCVRKCAYCDFLSVPYVGTLAEKYIDSLCKELALRKDSAGQLRTVYIGGGTPSLLSDSSLNQLYKCLGENFSLSEDAEISLEANPGTLDESKIDVLLSLGVTRISVGVQSFNDDELKSLGRIHTSEDAVRAVGLLRGAGLGNYSIDLMYGIPGQTMETWDETLSHAVRLSPCHISTYELTPEKKTPLYGFIQAGEIQLPDEDLVLDMYDRAIDHLSASGYEHYEISNFASPGFACIHNMNYWNRGEYIGAGVGAHSFMRGLRSRNADDIKAYCEYAGSGIIPSVETVRISPAEAAREFILLGLRKTGGISITEAEMYGLNIISAGSSLLEEGYLETHKDHLRLTRKGLPLSNTVFVKLYEELGL
jgi:oxygen-independent coproporphyrinogen-3 oxidase